MKEEIRLAYRENHIDASLLAGLSPKAGEFFQIVSFRKYVTNSEYLDEYMLLDTKPIAKYLSDEWAAFYEFTWNNPFSYVIHIDSILQFVNKQSLFVKLSSIFPQWKPSYFAAFFGDQPSGYIFFLRTYKIESPINPRSTIKGHQGSYQIIHLYDDFEEPVSYSVNITKPVIPDTKFDYIKDEIIHLIKSENAYVSLFNNDEIGRRNLENNIKATQSLLPRKKRQYDIEGNDDYAQIDYSKVFKEIIRKAPGTRQLLDYIMSIRPSQKGEADIIEKAFISGDEKARKRLIDTNLRAAIRNAYNFSQKYGTDIEETIQESLVGLLIATKKFNLDAGTKFASYSPLWERQNMFRELPIVDKYARIPMHIQEKLLPILDILRKEKINLEENYSENLLIRIGEELSCSKEDAKEYINYLQPAKSIDDAIVSEPSTFSDYGNIIACINDKVDYDYLKRKIESAIDSSLKPREKNVIFLRYGFYGMPMTLEDVGTQYGVTRERIRQIEAKAIKKLQKSAYLSEFCKEKPNDNEENLSESSSESGDSDSQNPLKNRFDS